MKEIGEILDAYDGLALSDARCALATVVAVKGSSYRKPGARMLVAEDGRSWGGVSGGCLERDVARSALGVIETARPVLCRYDTADEQEDGYGPTGPAVGCHGIIDIFIEPIARDAPGVPPPLRALARAYRGHQVSRSATLIRPGAGAQFQAGAHLSLDDDDVPLDFPQPHLAGGLIKELCQANRAAGLQIASIDTSGEWFIEVLQPPLKLICFGSGPDVVPLLAIGRLLGWRVQVVVTRPAPRAVERFTLADKLYINDADDPARDVEIGDADAVVLMTHNYPRDARILESIARGTLPIYLGILGPRHRADRLLAEIAGAERLQKNGIYAPVGLDLGAQNPEQIALAIAAEITAVTSKVTSERLRDLPGREHCHRSPTLSPARLRWSDACPT